MIHTQHKAPCASHAPSRRERSVQKALRELAIELGPRQTGKSFCFTEFSPYGTLLAGGAVTVPKLFVSNTQPPRKGLIANCDVVGFDEIAGSAFDADDNKNLYKNYIVPSCVSAGRGCRAGAMLVVGGTTLSGAPHASR